MFLKFLLVRLTQLCHLGVYGVRAEVYEQHLFEGPEKEDVEMKRIMWFTRAMIFEDNLVKEGTQGLSFRRLP